VIVSSYLLTFAVTETVEPNVPLAFTAANEFRFVPRRMRVCPGPLPRIAMPAPSMNRPLPLSTR
jgi:hypothetical protein